MKVETKMEVEVESIEVRMETDQGGMLARRDADGAAVFALDGVELPDDVAKRLLRGAVRRLMEEVVDGE